jgi:hypothetical protein
MGSQSGLWSILHHHQPTITLLWHTLDIIGVKPRRNEQSAKALSATRLLFCLFFFVQAAYSSTLMADFDCFLFLKQAHMAQVQLSCAIPGVTSSPTILITHVAVLPPTCSPLSLEARTIHMCWVWSTSRDLMLALSPFKFGTTWQCRSPNVRQAGRNTAFGFCCPQMVSPRGYKAALSPYFQVPVPPVDGPK